MYCYNCGKKVEDGVSVCPDCGTVLVKEPVPDKKPEVAAPVETPQKKKINLPPVTMVGLLFSAIAFVFGFIITTCALALNRGIAYVEYIAIIPAIIGLAIGAYKVFDPKTEKEEKKYCLIGAGVSLFVMFYAFIGFAVFIAG